MTAALLTLTVLVAATTLLAAWVRRDRLAVANRPDPATLPAHRRPSSRRAPHQISIRASRLRPSAVALLDLPA